MAQKSSIIIFLTAFILIYGGMHYYVLEELADIFHLTRNIWFYILMAFMILSYILAHNLESAFGNIITKSFYVLTSVWMGVLFLFFCSFIILDVLDLIFPIPGYIGFLIVIILLILTIYALLNSLFVHIKNITIKTTKIDKDMTIVHISDIHLGPMYGKAHLKNIVSHINRINPDIVLITGDLLDGRFKMDHGILRAFNSIISPIYMCTGNHDRYAGSEFLNELLKVTNVRVMHNDMEIVKGINIIGIDDSDDKDYAGRQLAKMTPLDNKKFNVLLYHRPDALKGVSKHNVDLMLSGHTHAGQIFPFNIIERPFTGYVYGLHKMNNTMIYVTSGAGLWGPPLRLGSNNEVVKISIKSGKR
jgi:uncharacterized protein